MWCLFCYFFSPVFRPTFNPFLACLYLLSKSVRLSFCVIILTCSIVIHHYQNKTKSDRLLPLPKDYISDNFNLAQLAPIVERIGYVAMGEDAIPVAKALQRYHRRQRSIANKASQQQKQQASSTSSSTSYSIYRLSLIHI